MKSYRCQLLLMRVALTGLFLLSSSAPNAASFFDKFIDPKDGMFDTSNWVLENKGFLPVPIVITEPAVGPGLGVAALFFHESKKEMRTPIPNSKRLRIVSWRTMTSWVFRPV